MANPAGNLIGKGTHLVFGIRSAPILCRRKQESRRGWSCPLRSTSWGTSILKSCEVRSWLRLWERPDTKCRPVAVYCCLACLPPASLPLGLEAESGRMLESAETLPSPSDPLLQPPPKQKRSSVACRRCRRLRSKCVKEEGGRGVCRGCIDAGVPNECQFLPRGMSAIDRAVRLLVCSEKVAFLKFC